MEGGIHGELFTGIQYEIGLWLARCRYPREFTLNPSRYSYREITLTIMQVEVPYSRRICHRDFSSATGICFFTRLPGVCQGAVPVSHFNMISRESFSLGTALIWYTKWLLFDYYGGWACKLKLRKLKNILKAGGAKVPPEEKNETMWESFVCVHQGGSPPQLCPQHALHLNCICMAMASRKKERFGLFLYFLPLREN